MKRTKAESSKPTDAETLQSGIKRSKLSYKEKKYNYNLLDLSDDVLLHIFKYLSSFDLMSLHLSCLRLNELCCDRTLWKSIDLRAQYLPLEELEKYVKFMLPATKLLALRGNRSKNNLSELDPDFLRTICLICNQLENLVLEDYSISQEKIQITDFPKTLKTLSLKGCHIFKEHLFQGLRESYLCTIDTHMPNLTCLILTNCNWLNSHSFMAISKIPKLKEVRLNSCYGLSEDVAYASIACRYGLKSLEVLDLRDTFIGDSVISSFSYTSTLTEIYLECPNLKIVDHHPVENLVEQRPQQEILYVELERPEVVYQGNPIAAEFADQNDDAFFDFLQDRCQVSDRSICALGLHNNENNQEIHNLNDDFGIIIQGKSRPSTNPNLKKLVVRNYSKVTNQTLLHFVTNAPNLEYLDVTGTAVTKDAIQNFKIQRPNVQIVSSFEEAL